MTTPTLPLDHRGTPTVRELLAELARTEDVLRGARCRGLTEADLTVARHQAAVVRELRRRRRAGTGGPRLP